MIGTGFTYDDTANLVTGGTITEIDILDTTDPTQTTQDHVLVNTNGWNINASAFCSARIVPICQSNHHAYFRPDRAQHDL